MFNKMICNFCKKEFGTRSSLNYHIKTAKYCLKIQGNLNDNNEYCNICNKIFSKKYFTTHFKNCNTNDYIKLNTIINENKEYIKDLEELNKKYLEEIIELRNTCDIYKSDHTCIQEIAKQPKNITTNNKILNVITPFNITDKEQIVDIVKNNYNINYIFSGQKGCARFVYENIIKDSEGNLKYICSDSSRFIYKYKDEYGNIQKDIDARRLTNLLIEGGLKNKACDMASEWWTDENGDVNTDKFEMLIEKAEAIRTMEQDNTEFKKELATMTSI